MTTVRPAAAGLYDADASARAEAERAGSPADGRWLEPEDLPPGAEGSRVPYLQHTYTGYALNHEVLPHTRALNRPGTRRVSYLLQLTGLTYLPRDM